MSRSEKAQAAFRYLVGEHIKSKMDDPVGEYLLSLLDEQPKQKAPAITAANENEKAVASSALVAISSAPEKRLPAPVSASQEPQEKPGTMTRSEAMKLSWERRRANLEAARRNGQFVP